MEHSPKYDNVLTFYNRKLNGKRLWDETKVANAVEKGWITPDEFTEITGQPYNTTE